ncbi:hypothetical protein ID866_11553 [Astraeus odoratus]|nr:hypothetical protein ID866_11553 [Astraeus odoratus]
MPFRCAGGYHHREGGRRGSWQHHAYERTCCA